MKKTILVCALMLVLVASVFGQQGLAFAEKPALVTSIGQSADFEMIKVLLSRAKIAFTADPLVKAETLNASSKTLILVVGASSKGLGAAGISAEDELKRTNALLKKAKELKMSVITLHVGGASRRGAMSDTLIKPCMAASDYAIVVTAGDEDGLFTTLAAQAKIPLTKVERLSSAGTPLAAAFK